MKYSVLKVNALIIIAVFTACCLCVPLASADDDSSQANSEKSALELKQLEVIGKKIADDVDPEAIVIDSQEIEKKQIWGINDLFLLTPGIEVGGGAPNARRLYLRGISDSLLTVTIDGARQNKDLRCSRGTMMNMDVDLLKYVEVEAGPTSADQGSANLGGSIRYTTKDAQDMLLDEKSMGLLAKTSYSSVSEGWRNSLALYGVYNDMGLLFYVTDTDTENYETGSGEEALGTAEEQRDYFAKFTLLNKANNDLRISVEKNTEEGLYPWTKPGDQGMLTDESLASRQELEQETVTLNHQFSPDSPYINTGLNIYSVDTSILNKDSNTKYTSDGVGGSLKNTFNQAWGTTKNALSIGTDYLNEEGKTSTGTFTSANLGFFAQDRFSYRNVHLSFGVRYDRFENEFNENDIDGNAAVSPNIKGSVDVGYGFSLFAGYGETVSGANTIPLNWVTNLAPNCTFNGEVNGTLDPERSKKKEVGGKFKKSGVFMAKDNLTFKATFFDTVIEDVIVAGTGGGMAAISDIVNDDDELETKGFELSAQWGIPKLDFYLGYAHNDVEYGDQDVSKTIQRTAATTGDTLSFAVNYIPSLQFNIGYTLIVVFDDSDCTDSGYNSVLEDGYVLHNLTVQYHPQCKTLKNFTLSLAINNIFDEQYSNQTTIANFNYPVQEPGRDIRLSLSYQF
nr:TonB-dependent receptor plug domain-containing protein [uncultured Desulfobacter sp.]